MFILVGILVKVRFMMVFIIEELYFEYIFIFFIDKLCFEYYVYFDEKNYVYFDYIGLGFVFVF